MLRSTLQFLVCPRQSRKPCGGLLSLHALESVGDEVRAGEIRCSGCGSKYPILAGIAVVVHDVHDYLCRHVKGVSMLVKDSEIPREHRADFQQARKAIQEEHIEEDLEARRVTALYVMNHYLSASGDASWFKPEHGSGSPLIESLVREYWDQGPLTEIGNWILDMRAKSAQVIELGCGVGGLLPRIRAHVGFYLGVDSSFGSIALARHLALGMPYSGSLEIPRDLLFGSVSNPIQIPVPSGHDDRADFVVGDADSAPVLRGSWDLSIALNMIDMLDDPAQLPRLQSSLLNSGGTAIQSCPYIWHEQASKKLRRHIPKSVRDSAQAVQWLYEKEGFTPTRSKDHLPWLFFKHLRQLEIYSVHLMSARKKDNRA